jgi:hypothetical protein
MVTGHRKDDSGVTPTPSAIMGRAISSNSDESKELLEVLKGTVTYTFCPKNVDAVRDSFLALDCPGDPSWAVKVVQVKGKLGFSIRMPDNLLSQEELVSGVHSSSLKKRVDEACGAGTWQTIPAPMRHNITKLYKSRAVTAPADSAKDNDGHSESL